MPTLLILIGPPATGKSTYRMQRCDNDPTWRYVNKDELRAMYPDDSERTIHERQQAVLNNYAQLGYNIIIDNTNLNPRTVEGYRAWAAKNGYDVEVKTFFDVPLAEAIKRDLARPNSVGRSVITKMYMQAGIYQPPKENAAVLCDLDGTLCDLTHRRHHVTGEGKKDWKGFFAALPDDEPNQAVKLVLKAVYGELEIIFLSGRPEEYRKPTEAWLQEHWGLDYTLLLMRNFNDRRDDTIVKQELYEQYVKPYFNVRLILDDRDRVVSMWRNLGLPCFQVNEGNF